MYKKTDEQSGKCADVSQRRMKIMAKICLIEDEKDLNQILKLYLEQAGHKVASCLTKAEFLRLQNTDSGFELYVLDIMLPDGNGIELLKMLKKENSAIPVILISARGESIDRVLGFEVGCDDYIAKPFLPAELVHRVNKALRLSSALSPQADILHFGPYIMDKNRRMVFHEENRVNLTSREYDLVLYLISNPSVALSRDTLIEKIWGEDCGSYDRVVDNYVKNIRKKLPEFPLETVYGYGYRCNL